jgi:single-strand DNA-binding protein
MSDLRVPDLNLVTIAGRLTRDPELKYTAGNRAYCRFGIANTRYFTSNGEKREETVFATCSAWDKQAEWIGERIKKGRPVLIEGGLHSWMQASDDYTDEKKGGIHHRLEIRARRVTPLDWDSNQQTGNTRSTEQAKPQEQPKEEDADIPF